MIERPWAFWRRLQYATGFAAFCVLALVGGLYLFAYEPASCFDNLQNGGERGVDCGGRCERICPFEVAAPSVRWVQAFRISPGMYNVVAYIDNPNQAIGASEVSYTFRLFDVNGGVITERSGTTFLPPQRGYPIFEGRVSTGGPAPARTELVLAPIESWKPMDVPPDQFIVESRSLADTDNLPRLDARVYNTSLREARGVEVVAVIFDILGNPLTASATEVPYFAGRTSTQTTFTWPSPIAKTIRSCEVPSDIAVVIDLSGSMAFDDPGPPPEPLTAALRAAEGFVGRLRSHDQVGVVTFASSAQVAEVLTGDRMSAAAGIRALTIGPAPGSSTTNIGDAIKAAHRELESERHNQNARKVIVLLTDGRANAPVTATAETYAIDAARAAKDAGVDLFAIGLGDDVSAEFIRTIASSPTHSTLAPTRDVLDDIYRAIGTAICEEGPAVIDIVPKVHPDDR